MRGLGGLGNLARCLGPKVRDGCYFPTSWVLDVIHRRFAAPRGWEVYSSGVFLPRTSGGGSTAFKVALLSPPWGQVKVGLSLGAVSESQPPHVGYARKFVSCSSSPATVRRVVWLRLEAE